MKKRQIVIFIPEYVEHWQILRGKMKIQILVIESEKVRQIHSSINFHLLSLIKEPT